MRIITVEALSRRLAGLHHPTPRVVASGNFAAPRALLSAFDAAVAEYRLFVLNPQPGIPKRAGVVPETPFVGPGMRGDPDLCYIPCRLSLVPRLLRTTTVPDVVLLNTSTVQDGNISLGTEVNILPAAIAAAHSRGGLVVAQLNKAMPFTYGDAQLPVDDIDFAIEVDEPLASPSGPSIDPVCHDIAERVAALVPERATLQLGIGGVPDAVLAALTGRHGLRVWTEMFSDGVLGLSRAGALDPDAILTTSFIFGSQELYDWVDRNPRISVTRTEKTNNPAWIARQPYMTSVNSALQVDLFGQANASYVRGRVYSGFGGQTDFIVGALHAAGGQALIALPSWHPRAQVSTIVPTLCEPATSFQHTYVVTEQGAARIWGESQHAQARHLIEDAAHPDAREMLRKEAQARGLM